VSFNPASLVSRLRSLETVAGKPERYVVAFSGGLDSTALLHCIGKIVRQCDEFANVPLLAIHIDHRLHSDSADWSAHCARFAKAHEIEFRSLCVKVALGAGKGPEAAARDARYRALCEEMASGDWLLSAHHCEDQAETLLLNLIRGSGPDGIAAIRAARRFDPGWLIRPLLDVNRAAILEYATAASLSWLQDPSNEDRSFDRNFLRHEVLPQFGRRWPDIAARLQRSAAHAGEAAELLAELARSDLQQLGGASSRLPIDALAELPPARQRNVIRCALRDLGLTTPSAQQLERVLTDVIPARIDAQPLVRWPGAAIRRYRNGLYLLPEKLATALDATTALSGALSLGAGLGALQLVKNAEVGVSSTLVDAGLEVRVRQGGEKFRPVGQVHTRKLKKLLQEEGIVPWMRDRLPLIYSGEQLVAVGDLWLADDAAARPGVAVRWTDRPALH